MLLLRVTRLVIIVKVEKNCPYHDEVLDLDDGLLSDSRDKLAIRAVGEAATAVSWPCFAMRARHRSWNK